MRELAVETTELRKQYGGSPALTGMSMRVEGGTVYGLLGRNGAGKTTTIRVLAGLVKASGGSARVLGLEAGRDRVEILRRTGFVIDKMLLPGMNGRDLVRFNRAFFPTWSDAKAQRYVEALEIPMEKKFRKLSDGNKTKLCLLMAMAQQPELLVLDEPTAGLDPVVTDALLRLLVEDFANEGRTVVLSSHHLSEIEKIAEWVGIVDNGRMLLEQRLDDIRARYRRVRAAGAALPQGGAEVLAVHGGDGVTEYVLRGGEPVFTAGLRGQGATVLEVSPLNLSEIFLELTGRGSHVPVETVA